jgi:hypothetical protein
MPELLNSRRRLEKVTYTPLILPDTDEGGSALQTAAAVAALGLEPGEAELAAKSVEGRERDVLLLMEQYVRAADTSGRLAASGRLARSANAVLAAAVEAIRVQRERILTETVKDLGSLIREYQAAQARANETDAGGVAQLSERVFLIENQMGRMMAQAGAGTQASTHADTGAAVSLAAPKLPVPAAPLPPPPEPVATRLGKELAAVAHAAAAWTDRKLPERARRFTDIPAAVVPASLRESAVDLLMSGLSFLIAQARITATVKSSLTTRELQPLGLLHLEQLVITPLDVERGELIYSLPLAPNERVTLSHKEWSLRQEEYSRFVQDHFENYSERGVAEKTDIAVSSKSETEHSKTMSMSRPLAPGGATLAGAVGTEQVADVTKEKQSQEQSRRDTREITEKASSLAVRDQKVSFTVATVSGTEDFTARVYENPHKDKVMLIDYFRRMRKWRNQLYRTGIRLTYDVVLPDPGKRLRDRWNAIAQLDAELGGEFQPPLQTGRSSIGTSLTGIGVATGATGTLTGIGKFTPSTDIEQMSPANIEFMAREYGVTLPPAPNELTSTEEIWPIKAHGPEPLSFDLTLEIPPDYRPTGLWIGGRLAQGGDDQVMIADYWKNRTATVLANEEVRSFFYDIRDEEFTGRKLPVGFIVYAGAVGEARAKVALEPTPEAWRKWRSAAYAAIRQGALTKWTQKREVLRQQRAALVKELAAPDTLSLRRMEREQIMYTVLEWLFPEFGQKGQMYQSLASAISVLEYGEYIKFVHDAVDWERILVLLYPYFWDRPENHYQKLYLDHADGTHKEFLRAGACRVVLAIKPGYEEKLVSLLDKGQLGNLAPASRFRDTIELVQAVEKEFVENRSAASEPGEDGEPPEEVVEPGQLIGAWHEWTPTSAMDMDVTLQDLQ